MPLCVCRYLLSWTPSVSSCGWLTGGPNMQSISSLEMIPHCFWLDLALNPIFPIWRWHLFQIYWGLRFVESGGLSHFGAIIPGGGRTEFKKKLHSSISSKFEFKQSNSTQSLSSVLLVSKKMLIRNLSFFLRFKSLKISNDIAHLSPPPLEMLVQ